MFANPSPLSTANRSYSGSDNPTMEVSLEKYNDDPDKYFSNLEQLRRHAEATRKKESEEERKLIEYLPVNEKFSFNKEGKVLTRWQERQRDWNRIQLQIERKLRSKIKRPLMMTTADEYRAKMEELDLLQASVPDEDRFNESSWQAGLRGGGAIRQPVGHIFSGLECKYEQALPRPTLVRKPKASDFVGKNDTFVEQSEKYMETRKKYGKYYRSIRPHDLTYSEAHHLVIRSTDLFQWAQQSSQAYFESRSDAAAAEALTLTLAAIAAEEESLSSSVEAGGEVDAAVGAGSVDLPTSKVDFLSSKELSFDASIGHQSMVQVQFKNTGSTSVAYRWRSLSPDNYSSDAGRKQVDKSRITIVDKSELKPGTAGDKHTLKDVLTIRNTPSVRAHALSQQRDHFFCLRDAGEVLPDDTVTTTFVFRSRAGGGSFYAQWILEFVPDATKVFHVATNQSLPGSIVCSLRGHCHSVDESLKKRSFVSSYIEQATVQAMATDIVFQCLKRVRDPVRLRDMHQRQVDLFRSMNQDLLAAIDLQYGTAAPTFITISRLEKFCTLYLKALDLFDKVSNMLRSLLDQRGQWSSTASKVDAVGDGRSSAHPLLLSESDVDAIELRLFPEKFIEIFDEITEEDVRPRWNYNLASMLSSLSQLQQRAAEVAVLEDEIASLKAADLKEKLKAQRKAERLAALDSDEEYEEEEEEEEEPIDEEEEVVDKPLHPLVAEVRALSSSLHSGIQLLLIHELPMDSITALASEIIGEIAEKIVDSHEAALTSAGILDPSVIPSVASPFTTEEGKEAWRVIVDYKPSGGEVDPKAKGGKPPSKPAKGTAIAAAPVELTTEQVNSFYKAMFDGVHASISDVSVNMFAAVDELLSADASTKVYSSACRVSRDALFDLSVVRKVDLASIHSGKVAFLNWEGDAFAEQEHVSSAFNVAETNKAAAIQPILKLVEYEAQAIVLLYESNLTASTQGGASSILPHFDEISALMQAKYEEHKLANDKLLKKNKQKPGYYKKLSFLKFASFAEFYFEMDRLLSRPDYDLYFSETIPIVVLENIAIPGVVPSEPAYEEAVSDDEDAPIATGLQESILHRRKTWESKRPHRVKVTVNTGGGTYNRSHTADVECFADPSSAISEAYYRKPTIRPHDVIWVECSGGKIFDPKSAFDELHVDGRFVSEQIREMFLWLGVFQILPAFAEFLVDEKGSVSGHLGKLFPASVESKAAPTSTAVLGGSIRADKFCVLDQLLDLVDTVVLGGELSLAFLSASRRCVFEKYKFYLSDYHDVCSALLMKAKMKGCRLVLPVDLTVGDLSVSHDDKEKCFQKFELDARNEGVEYEGETKVFECTGGAWDDDFSNAEPGVVKGFAYDIGPKSCQVLQDVVAATELLLVWGLVGVSESSSFQSGQAALVNCSSSNKADNDVTANSSARRSPLQTVLIGDSTVEWYARMLDSDGELDGDLVGAGMVAYSLRASSILAGAMGMCSSRTLQSKLKLRPSLEDEWIYSQKKLEVEEEEEEDDDDDDE